MPQPQETPSVPLDEIEKLYETDPNAAAWKMIEGMSLEERIYQLFIVAPEALSGGAAVTEVTDAVREGFAKYPVGGVVLFGDNINNREQVMRLTADLQGASKYPLFIAVDEEGGTVSRLGSVSGMDVTKQPPMREVGDAGDANRAYEIGKTMAQEICALGFNVNFAPCADTLVDPDNEEIGSRSFGTDPNVVSTMVENMVKGLREGGVASTLKHFPGHGSAQSDSHSGRAISTRTYDEISAIDLLPFKAGIEAGTDFVMISHMVNESNDQHFKKHHGLHENYYYRFPFHGCHYRVLFFRCSGSNSLGSRGRCFAYAGKRRRSRCGYSRRYGKRQNYRNATQRKRCPCSES